MCTRACCVHLFMCEHKAASVMMGKATAVNGPTLNQRGASTVLQEEEQQSAEAKSAFQWQKLRANRTKVIKFISEEDTQEQAAVLQELVDEYRAHQIAADRKVCSRMCVHTCPKVRIHFFSAAGRSPFPSTPPRNDTSVPSAAIHS